ncbi:MAG: Pyruvate, water dikinase [uncultured bacterium]|nr:MAG: Pyruvate, water dikinase [uncultured bacterium]
MEFWTRELKLPLFWMTDKNHLLFSGGILVFYKNNVIHLYTSGERREKLSKEGYEFFRHAKNVTKYEKQSLEILEKMNDLVGYLKDKDIKNISDNEINDLYLKFINILNLYSNIYTKTEPFCTEKFNQESGKYSNTVNKLGKIRFKLRKEGEIVFYNFLGILIKEIGKRFDTKVIELFFYTYEEMILLLAKNKKVNKNIIDKRKKGYLLFIDGQEKEIITGKKFIDTFKKFNASNNKKEKKLFGAVAMCGKARGRVKLILHNRRNISKKVSEFKKGEILVTEMTRPGTIVACNQAAAIITDEGGITSHAAVIARELKIPCIVGTKHATQVLKDGDLVEVNANRGVVKIIK